MQRVPRNLTYYPDSRPGIRRQRRGRGFSYIAPDGTRIDDREERRRISALAVPPAYEDVWISPREDGHLQATGRDARQRKQYRYHEDWTSWRSEKKFDHLGDFGEALPRIRSRIRRLLDSDPGSPEFAIGATLALIDRLSVRVGHPAYVEENGSHGITTAKAGHLSEDGDAMKIRYVGKGGARVEKVIRHRKLQRVLNRLQDLPGAELIGWTDETGETRHVRSDMVNDTLFETTGHDALTAKTFRTWNGSVAALEAALSADKITISAMSDAAATELCNTPAISRTSYIHPRVIELANDPAPLARRVPEITGLRQIECRLLALVAT
jgi:DNA topoisomerase-1